MIINLAVGHTPVEGPSLDVPAASNNEADTTYISSQMMIGIGSGLPGNTKCRRLLQSFSQDYRHVHLTESN